MGGGRHGISEDKMILKNLEFPKHFLKNEEKRWNFQGIFSKMRKNGGISNTLSKNPFDFRAYFEFLMEFLRLYFLQKTVSSAGGIQKFSGIVVYRVLHRLSHKVYVRNHIIETGSN